MKQEETREETAGKEEIYYIDGEILRPIMHGGSSWPALGQRLTRAEGKDVRFVAAAVVMRALR